MAFILDFSWLSLGWVIVKLLIFFLSACCLNRVAVPVLENQSARRETRLCALCLLLLLLFFHASSVAAADCDAFDLPNVPRIWLHSVVFCSALLRSVLFCSVLVGSDLSKSFRPPGGRSAASPPSNTASPGHPAMINDAFCCDSF